VSAAERVLGRLAGVRQNAPGRWIARCPSHEDRSPSLSVRELEDGRVLLHDFAGCGVEDVLGALGLTLADLFEEPLAHSLPRTHTSIPARDLGECKNGWTGLGLEEGIAAARTIFLACWFDERRCEAGLRALQFYRREWKDRQGQFSALVHDSASHGADAFRYFAVASRLDAEEFREGLKLPSLDQLYPKWADDMRRYGKY